MEAGDNKKALHEADKLLKKQNNLEVAKVLKALSLLRLGQKSECERLVSEVHNQSPTESCALRAMRACYTELQRLDLLCEAYENAIKQDPADLDLHLQLYSTYLRQSDYKRAQQLALAMSKRFPTGPYFLWAVMGLCLQAIQTTDRSIADRALLPLARRLLEKSFEPDGQPKTEADLELYLHVLDLQRDHGRALQVIEQQNGRLNNDRLGFVSSRKALLLRISNQPAAAFDEFVQIARRFPDQFEAYEHMIDIALDAPLPQIKYDWNSLASIVAVDQIPMKRSSVDSGKENGLNHSNSNTDTGPLDISTSDRDFLNEIIELVKQQEEDSISSGNTVRAPLVAKLMLLHKLRHDAAKQATLAELFGGNVLDQLVFFFSRFGHKGATLSDMAHLIKQQELTKEDRQLLAERIEPMIKDESIDNFDQLYRYSTCTGLQISAGYFDTPLSKESIAKMRTMLNLHRQVATWSSGQLRTDFNSAEPLVQLCIQILDGQVYQNDACLWLALSCLWRVTRTPSPNYTQRLLLVQAFAACGAASCVTELFVQLDLKHIQRDSLGYFVYSIAEAAQFSQSASLLTSALRFFHSSAKCTSEQLLNCFQCGSFERVHELLRLRNQLLHSMHRAYVYVARPLLDLINSNRPAESIAGWLSALNIDPFVPEFDWKRVYDNRDFTVLRPCTWNVAAKADHDRQLTLKQLRFLCQARDLTLRLLISLPRITDSVTTPSNDDSESYAQLLQFYEQFVHFVKSFKLKSRKQTLFGPQSVGFESFTKSAISDLLIEWFRLPLLLAMQPMTITQDQLNQTLIEPFRQMLDRLKTEYDQTIHMYQVTSLFESVHWILEAVSVFVTVIQLVWLQYNPKTIVLTSSKGGKKAVNRPTVAQQPLIVFLINESEQLISQLQSTIKSMQFKQLLQFETIVSKSDQIIDEADGIRAMNEIRKMIESSYDQTKREYLEVVQNKLRLLNVLGNKK